MDDKANKIIQRVGSGYTNNLRQMSVRPKGQDM